MMKNFKKLAFCVLIYALTLTSLVISQEECKPTQVHTSLGDFYSVANTKAEYEQNKYLDEIQLYIIYHTTQECANNTLELMNPSSKKLNEIKPKQIKEWKPNENYKTYIHIYELSNLELEKPFSYVLNYESSGAIQKLEYNYQLPSPFPESNKTRIAYFTDLDNSESGNQTINKLGSLVQGEKTIDLIIHGGHLVYEVYSDDGKKADSYFESTSRFSAYRPYLITPGDDEKKFQYEYLTQRIRTPSYGTSQTQYYSFNIGKIHFVVMNIDYYLDNSELQQKILNWLQTDLEAASDTKNRTSRPWIVFVAHKPIYCSGNEECCKKNPEILQFLEDLLVKHKVDLYLTGHLKNYERTYPVQNGKVAGFKTKENQPKEMYIIDAQAPVHVMEGSPGNSAWPSKVSDDKKEYTASKIYNIEGFGVIEAVNDTHLYYSHLKSADESILDDFYIIKNWQIINPQKASQYGHHILIAIISFGVLLSLFLGYFLYKSYKQNSLHVEETYKSMFYSDLLGHKSTNLVQD